MTHEAEHWTLRMAGGETVTLDRTRPGVARLRVDLYGHGQVAFLTTAQLRALALAVTALADALDTETTEGAA